jgi:hypothetical protein
MLRAPATTLLTHTVYIVGQACMHLIIRTKCFDDRRVCECASVNVCLINSRRWLEASPPLPRLTVYVISCSHVSRGPHPQSRTMMMLTPLRAETLDVSTVDNQDQLWSYSQKLTYLGRFSVPEVYSNDSKRNRYRICTHQPAEPFFRRTLLLLRTGIVSTIIPIKRPRAVLPRLT